MTNKEKEIQLKRFKRLATGLFLLMAVLYFVSSWLMHYRPATWIGYVRAFTEAGMVGALADWFAVTALFNYPLGLRIPHTNLIENSKARIGDNLGNFVVSNFLTAENIKPYIDRLSVASKASDWMAVPANQSKLINGLSEIIKDVLDKLDDEQVTGFIGERISGFARQIDLGDILSKGIHHLLQNNEQEKIVTSLTAKIKQLIAENQSMIQQRVAKESYFFVPKFLDNKIGQKITVGLYSFFDEIENNPGHDIRHEINERLTVFAESLKDDPKWQQKLQDLLNAFLANADTAKYGREIWTSIKTNLLEELHADDSKLKKYISKSLSELSTRLKSDPVLQQRIDGWIRVTAYKYILKNAPAAGTLISDTVGNWKGRELSEKLELEVGKDLQFIRINGTLVGGLVGVLIHLATELLFR